MLFVGLLCEQDDGCRGKLALLPKEAFLQMHSWTRISFNCSVFQLSAYGYTGYSVFVHLM